MAETNLNVRIVNKHDTETNWSKATEFVPKQGELIIYDRDKDHPYERFKIGDGKSKVNELKFFEEKIATLDGQNSKKLNANEDLNFKTELGTYICYDPTTAGDISNRPTNESFIMYVKSPFPGNSDYIVQEVYELNGGTRSYRFMYPEKEKDENGNIVYSWTSWTRTFDDSGSVINKNGGYFAQKTVNGSEHKAGFGVNGNTGAVYVNHSTNGAQDNYMLLSSEHSTFHKPLDVSGGGTGASTVEEARAKLKITPENIGALSTSGGTLKGDVVNIKGNYKVQKTINGKVHESGAGVNGQHGATFLVHSTDGVPDNYMWLKPDSTYFQRPVGVSSGGTGAATTAEARANLEITPANIGAAHENHGTHVEFDDENKPKEAGEASVGEAPTVSRSDHVHPAQTNISGTATNAINDANGKAIVDTYATKDELADASKILRGTLNKDCLPIIPVEKGGFGTTTIAAARQKLNFFGSNPSPITSVDNDTVSNWASFGTGIAYISGKTDTTAEGGFIKVLFGQPEQYGWVESTVSTFVDKEQNTYSYVNQVWRTNDGPMYMRSGSTTIANNGGWFASGWTKLVDSTDVVNNLYSDATNKPLSAAQGKVLQDTKANISHGHSVNDITGAIPIDKGGTGADNKEDARANLGAAPGNFGLGEVGMENSNIQVGTIKDLNEKKSNGFWAYGNKEENLTKEVSSKYVKGITLAYSPGAVTQIGVCNANGKVIIREFYQPDPDKAGGWTDWTVWETGDKIHTFSSSKNSGNGNVELILETKEKNSSTDSTTQSIAIKGSGATKVTSNENGVITVNTGVGKGLECDTNGNIGHSASSSVGSITIPIDSYIKSMAVNETGHLTQVQLADYVDLADTENWEEKDKEELNLDLNNMTEVGIYSCIYSALAEKIKNCPTSYYFKMTVSPLVIYKNSSGALDSNKDKILQELTAYGGTKYCRTGSKDKGVWTWSRWNKNDFIVLNSSSEDTPKHWYAQGDGKRYIQFSSSSGLATYQELSGPVKGQPTQYGILENIVGGTEDNMSIKQFWYETNGANCDDPQQRIYTRYNKNSEEMSDWKEVGVSEGLSIDLGTQYHNASVENFVKELNTMAKSIGMTKTSIKTPSGLPVDPNRQLNVEYNSLTSAKQLALMMAYVRHQPSILKIFGAKKTNYYLNNKGKYLSNKLIGFMDWVTDKGAGDELNWKGRFKVLATKGGSLNSTVYTNEQKTQLGIENVSKPTIANYAILIKDTSNSNIYTIGVMGLENGEKTSEGVTAIRDIVYHMLKYFVNSDTSASNYLVNTYGNRSSYPVPFYCVKLLESDTFEADKERFTAEEHRANRLSYSKQNVLTDGWPSASTIKVLTALGCAAHFDNRYVSMVLDDFVDDSNDTDNDDESEVFDKGDHVSTMDLMYLMALDSNNVAATALAREYGKRINFSTLFS